ncbi:TnpV protein [Eubacterium sp.]
MATIKYSHKTKSYQISSPIALLLYNIIMVLFIENKMFCYNLLTSGKLNSYLVDIEQQAQQLFLRLVKDLAEQEKVTEELKATDMMLWVQKMNNIRNRTTEIVNERIIYNI